MAWYKTGKVSVTTGQTSVTATGTKFATNARVGDGFRAPDGEWYEITNIASETVLGIYPAYVGPSLVESTDYMIAPLQGYNKESADRLRAITDSIRDFSDDVAAAAESAAEAKVSEDAAKASELAAKASENAAKTSETNAKASEDDAEAAALAAAASEDAANLSAIAAKSSEDAAELSEANALASQNAAKTSENAAKTSETNSKASENAAKASELAAKTSETNSKASELAADADASTATTAASDALAAELAAQAAQELAEQARDDAIAAAGTVTGQLMDQGPWDASTGVYPAKPTVSSFWKVTGAGSATDAGETISYGIGDTLMWSKPINNFYKIDNTESVSSVNGYTGVIVLDKGDVGLSNADNTSDANKPVSTAQQTSLNLKIDKASIVDNLESTDATKVLSAKQGKTLYDLVQANNNTLVVYEYVATLSQTIFSGADIHGQVLNFQPGPGTIVFQNGVQLQITVDYSTSSGNQVTLVKPVDQAGDVIQVLAFGSFSVANHYTMAQDDAFLALKADKAETDTKFETTSTALGNRYTKAEDDAKFVAKTDIIDIAHGGTGVTTTPALLSALQTAGAYGKSNAVGTVSQAAGVPTGAIVERGSNSQGEYTRWADGTQICTRSNSFGGGTVANGSAFRSLSVDMGSFAANFIGAPTTVANGIAVATGGGWAGQQTFGTATTWGNWSVYTTVAVTGNLSINLIAIGRWF